MSLHRETRELLNKYQLKAKKKLGQNFLVDERAIKREIGYAHLRPGEHVLEIGPGIGNLTKYLLGEGVKVTAIEKEQLAVEILQNRFKRNRNLEILEGDFLEAELPEFDKCISNIPYVISSPLTFRLLKEKFKLAILTYQKEFAKRMVAIPGTRDYSRLSVALYFYSDVEILEYLPPGSFYPIPKVESAIVRITPKTPPFEVDRVFFFRFLTGIFSHKKKTLKNAIKDSYSFVFKGFEKPDDIAEIIPKKFLDKRVFKLSPEELAEISNLLGELNEI